MSDPFVPFNASPTKGRMPDSRFRVQVVPTSDALPSFMPVAPLTPTALAAAPAAALAPTPGHAVHEPHIQLDRDGDRITRITVRCACGQVIELNCAY